MGLVVDQKMREGEMINFFGMPAPTPMALAKLALQFNCDIIPIHVYRTKGIMHEITVLPPLKITKTGKDLPIKKITITENIQEIQTDPICV